MSGHETATDLTNEPKMRNKRAKRATTRTRAKRRGGDRSSRSPAGKAGAATLGQVESVADLVVEWYPVDYWLLQSSLSLAHMICGLLVYH